MPVSPLCWATTVSISPGDPQPAVLRNNNNYVCLSRRPLYLSPLCCAIRLSLQQTLSLRSSAICPSLQETLSPLCRAICLSPQLTLSPLWETPACCVVHYVYLARRLSAVPLCNNNYYLCPSRRPSAHCAVQYVGLSRTPSACRAEQYACLSRDLEPTVQCIMFVPPPGDLQPAVPSNNIIPVSPGDTQPMVRCNNTSVSPGVPTSPRGCAIYCMSISPGFPHIRSLSCAICLSLGDPQPAVLCSIPLGDPQLVVLCAIIMIMAVSPGVPHPAVPCILRCLCLQESLTLLCHALCLSLQEAFSLLRCAICWSLRESLSLLCCGTGLFLQETHSLQCWAMCRSFWKTLSPQGGVVSGVSLLNCLFAVAGPGLVPVP